MKDHFKSHVFWGSQAPLSTLTSGGLLLMASCRLAFAIVITGALLWVYGLTALVFFSFRSILPKKGKSVILVFLASLMGGVYLLLFWFMNPLAALGSLLLIILVPVSCVSSGIFFQTGFFELGEVVSRALSEAAALGLLIVAFALIREPFGFSSLSFPVGAEGIAELFGGEDGTAFFPVRIVSASSGGLLLLGYGLALFRRFQKRRVHGEKIE